MIKRIIEIGIKIIAVCFFILAVWLVYKEIQKVGLSSLWQTIVSIPPWVLFVALCFIFCDYLCFSGYDFIALKYIGQKVPVPNIIQTAMISFSVTNTTGHAYLAGGSVRYLMYSKFGLSELQILKMTAFESLTFLIGMITVLDISLMMCHFMKIPKLSSYGDLFLIGSVFLTALFISYYLFFILPKRKIIIGKTSITAPTKKQTLFQIIIGSFDILSSSLVFYTLLRYHMDVNFAHVICIFTLAQVIGISSQVPGGLGVFEGAFLTLFNHTPAEKGLILASLLTFRVLYYFLPLFISGIFLLIKNISDNYRGVHPQ